MLTYVKNQWLVLMSYGGFSINSSEWKGKLRALCPQTGLLAVFYSG